MYLWGVKQKDNSYDFYGQSKAIRDEYFYRCRQTNEYNDSNDKVEANCIYCFDKNNKKYIKVTAELDSSTGEIKTNVEEIRGYFDNFDEQYFKDISLLILYTAAKEESI